MSAASTDISAIQRALKGLTELVRFELTLQGGVYELRLTLGDGKGTERTLLCHDVQNLELNPTGDGFTRLARLEIEDLSGEGLDRVNFSVDELEQETLFLHCAGLELA